MKIKSKVLFHMLQGGNNLILFLNVTALWHQLFAIVSCFRTMN
jgi:hypothetical protein